jgi:hypothetical protein
MKEYYFKTDDMVIWRPTGILDLKKIHAFINFLNEQISKRDPHYIRFIDLSQISGISINYEEVHSIAAVRKEYASKELRKKVKMAIYVRDALSFGMARMYESILDQYLYEINIFYDLQEVANFLQVDVSLLSE